MIGSTITAVHPQGASITDKSSSYTIKMTDEEYLIDGYETFDVGGQYTMNCYVEMLMYSARVTLVIIVIKYVLTQLLVFSIYKIKLSFPSMFFYLL